MLRQMDLAIRILDHRRFAVRNSPMSFPGIEQLELNARAGKPEAQFLLSQVCHQGGDLDGMMHWLQAAAATGMPDALAALASCYETGTAVDRDLSEALQRFDKAIAAGSAVAKFRKAELLYKSTVDGRHDESIRALLLDAADQGVAPALRTVAYLLAQHRSRHGLAAAVFRTAAEKGDPVAAPMRSTYFPGHPDVPQSPAALADALADIPLRPPREAGTVTSVNESPAVRVYKNVLHPVDCTYLARLSEPRLVRAQVIDPNDRSRGQVSNVRTSSGTYLPPEVVDFISRYIELKIVYSVGESLERSEPMSILRYGVGEYYRPHFDFFKPDLDVSVRLMQDGGQRTSSAVTYIGVPEQGGGTGFPELGFSVPAELGATLWFRNCHDDGQVDERSLHAGEPVEAGVKWVVTKWFRERSTRYFMEQELTQ